jgi:hypothetical protein
MALELTSAFIAVLLLPLACRTRTTLTDGGLLAYPDFRARRPRGGPGHG